MGSRRTMLLAPVVAAAIVAAGAGARAQEPPEANCSTPRRAVETWLGNLGEGRERPELAVRCFDWRGAGLSGAERLTRARALVEVLDARGLYVEVDELPDAADADGAREVHLFEDELPDVYLVRDDDRWVVSAETIRKIPELHREAVPLDVDTFVETLPSWMRVRTFVGLAWWQILAAFVVVLAAFVVRQVVAWLVSSWGGRALSRWKLAASADLVAKAALPIGTIAMAGALYWALPLLRFGVRVNQLAHIGIRVLAAVSAVFVLYRVVDVIADLFAKRAQKTDTKLDDQLVPLVRRSLKTVVVLIGVIFVLQNLDVDVTSLLALGTVGTLAVSFAAKDVIANLFGSVSIFAERPFQVGDWVVIGDIEGVIDEVGMRSTRIRTFYDSMVTMPNSTITVTPVDNYGARRYRRCSTTLNLTYDTTPEQMEAFCDGLRAILTASPPVRKDYYEVHFASFGAHSLDVMLYFFFEVSSWTEELRARHLVFLEILRLAEDLGVAFAFPTQTLHVDSVAHPVPPTPRRVPQVADLERAVLAFAPGGASSRPDGPRVSPGFRAGASTVATRGHADDGEG